MIENLDTIEQCLTFAQIDSFKPMAINITIPDSQLDSMIEYYIGLQKSKKDTITGIEKEIKEISSIVLQLKKAKTDQPQQNGVYEDLFGAVYNPKWPWVKKIEYAMNEAGKPVTTKEIVEIITKYEPEYIAERKKAVASVSATLSQKSGSLYDKKEFVRSESETGETAYSVWDQATYDFEQMLMGMPPEPTQVKFDDLPF